MATIKVNGVKVEYRQSGSGRDFLLLHSLLTEMSVFDAIAPVPRARGTRFHVGARDHR